MKTNKQIKMELSKKLSPKIEELVNQRVEDNKKNGVSCSRSYIADQLGIDRNTLNFYINGDNGTGVDAEPRIPDIIGLYKIKNFFDVPYSYLFDETFNTKCGSDNIALGTTYGLNDKTQQILKELRIKANNETINDNYLASIKLFLINKIIENDSFLESMALYFLVTLGQNILDEKYKGRDNYSMFSSDNSIYSFTKYSLMENFLQYINTLTTGDNVPLSTKKDAEEYAIKYGGSMQAFIKQFIIEDKSKKKKE